MTVYEKRVQKIKDAIQTESYTDALDIFNKMKTPQRLKFCANEPTVCNQVCDGNALVLKDASCVSCDSLYQKTEPVGQVCESVTCGHKTYYKNCRLKTCDELYPSPTYTKSPRDVYNCSSVWCNGLMYYYNCTYNGSGGGGLMIR